MSHSIQTQKASCPGPICTAHSIDLSSADNNGLLASIRDSVRISQQKGSNSNIAAQAAERNCKPEIQHGAIARQPRSSCIHNIYGVERRML